MITKSEQGAQVHNEARGAADPAEGRMTVMGFPIDLSAFQPVVLVPIRVRDLDC